MTDSIENLTESVVAGGNLVEGERAKYMCHIYKNGFPCEECSHALWIFEIKQRWTGDPELFPYRFDQALEDHQTHIDIYTPRPQPIKKVNRHALGPREFTLTYSPKWFDDVEARRNMSVAVDKLMKYNCREITYFRAVGEVGTNGLSHVLCYYELQGGKKITDKNFKRAWRYWDPSIKYGKGFQGGHHQEVKNTADFLGYIDKEIDTAWLDKSFPADI